MKCTALTNRQTSFNCSQWETVGVVGCVTWFFCVRCDGIVYLRGQGVVAIWHCKQRTTWVTLLLGRLSYSWKRCLFLIGWGVNYCVIRSVVPLFMSEKATPSRRGVLLVAHRSVRTSDLPTVTHNKRSTRLWWGVVTERAWSQPIIACNLAHAFGVDVRLA
jgi:hypothetical protein